MTVRGRMRNGRFRVETSKGRRSGGGSSRQARPGGSYKCTQRPTTRSTSSVTSPPLGHTVSSEPRHSPRGGKLQAWLLERSRYDLHHGHPRERDKPVLSFGF